ncbi:MAG: hypothetical protein ACD_23C01200G0001, partial [uncultured bacterium]
MRWECVWWRRQVIHRQFEEGKSFSRG